MKVGHSDLIFGMGVKVAKRGKMDHSNFKFLHKGKNVLRVYEIVDIRRTDVGRNVTGMSHLWWHNASSREGNS